MFEVVDNTANYIIIEDLYRRLDVVSKNEGTVVDSIKAMIKLNSSSNDNITLEKLEKLPPNVRRSNNIELIRKTMKEMNL